MKRVSYLRAHKFRSHHTRFMGNGDQESGTCVHPCCKVQCLSERRLELNTIESWFSTASFERWLEIRWNQLLQLIAPRVKRLVPFTSAIPTPISITITALWMTTFCFPFGRSQVQTPVQKPAEIYHGLFCIYRQMQNLGLNKASLTTSHNISYILFTIQPSTRRLTFRHRASSIYDRRFAALQRTLFIYLINKHISLSDICLTVHHWYK